MKEGRPVFERLSRAGRLLRCCLRPTVRPFVFLECAGARREGRAGRRVRADVLPLGEDHDLVHVGGVVPPQDADLGPAVRQGVDDLRHMIGAASSEDEDRGSSVGRGRDGRPGGGGGSTEGGHEVGISLELNDCGFGP